MDPPRADIICMCKRALAGDVLLDEFYGFWPEPADDPALAPAREALEDAVTHIPGRFFRRGVDLKAWRRSPQYDELKAQLQRLAEQA